MATYRRLARRCGLTPLGKIGEKKSAEHNPRICGVSYLVIGGAGFSAASFALDVRGIPGMSQTQNRVIRRALLHCTALRFAISARRRWRAFSALSITPVPSAFRVIGVVGCVAYSRTASARRRSRSRRCTVVRMPSFRGAGSPFGEPCGKVRYIIALFRKKAKIFFRHRPCARYRQHPRYIQTIGNNLAKH